MTRVLMIRHAATNVAGRVLTGRLTGVHISEEGAQQATRLASYLRDIQLKAIYSSPLERALETAQPISQMLGIPIKICESLNEFDFGAWSGLAIEQLQPLPHWTRFNDFRSTTAPPGGELMLEIQARVVRVLEQMRLEHAEEAAALISHGDVIRASLCHYLGMPLDLFQRLEISPASISTILLEDEGVRVLGINQSAPACAGG